MLTRDEIEKREKKQLASYAARASESRGRVYPSKEHPLRTSFQRDRDRIIHSSAFRRMEYKTQVFIPHETDHYRTRLTHTIEVAQISRTIARSLQLNEDIAEAIALVHDVGHTPFGHSGEDVLTKLLEQHGGFNHNRQSLRVVDLLEQRYDEHPGLNLSYEVREGIVKHETSVEVTHPDFDRAEHPTLEASLVDMADEIAYNAHDIDDGLSSGLITVDDIKKLKFWKFMFLDHIVYKLESGDDIRRYALVRGLLDFMVTDLINETQQRLKQHKIKTLDDVRQADERLCSFSDVTQIMVFDIKAFLNKKLYKHTKMISMSEWAEEIITTIFRAYTQKPELLPKRFQEMLLTEDAEIVVADYIAGMTDRYAIKIYDGLA